MPIVTAAILPHGGGLVRGFEEAEGDYALLRHSVVECSKKVLSKSPETVVIVTPHNLRIRGVMGVIGTEYLTGTVVNGRHRIKIDIPTDRELANRIYSVAQKMKLPVAFVNYGTDSGSNSRMPLDWGTIIPLHFLRSIKKAVLLTPSREIPWSNLVDMGVCVDKAASEFKRRVLFVASADQAHAHDKNGPYGYDPAAAKFDKLVLSILKGERLKELLSIDKTLVEDAKPDSLWQMLMLAGAIASHSMKLQYLQYDRPSYYGMLAAAFY
ncbi:MAG: hypothetical protein JRN68_03370 [Nitrososphaerota archaeon]|nr:hypothetical protein [Nitrososphaerota archaeon]